MAHSLVCLLLLYIHCTTTVHTIYEFNISQTDDLSVNTITEANFVVTNELRHRYEVEGEITSELGGISEPEGGHTSELGGNSEPEDGHTSELGGICETEGGHTSELGGISEPEGVHTSELGGIPELKGVHTSELGGISEPEGVHTSELGGILEPEGVHTGELGGITEPEDGNISELGGITEHEGVHTSELGGILEPEGVHTSELGGITEPEDGHISELGGITEPEDGHTSELGGITEPEDGQIVIESESELNYKPKNESIGKSDTTTIGTHDILPNWESVNELRPEAEAEPDVEPDINLSKQLESTENSAIDVESEAEFEAEFGLGGIYILVTIYCLCMSLIISGNVLVAVVIMKSHQLRKNTSNIFLMSLVSARACIGIFVIPVRISALFSEKYLGSILCKLCHFGALGSSCVSVFSIAAIAIVKCYAVANTTERLTIRQSIWVITVLWSSGFLYAIRAAILNDLQVFKVNDIYIWSCAIKPIYSNIYIYIMLADMIFLCILPFGIVLICHFHIISSLKHNIAIILLSRGIVMRHNAKTVRMLIILMTLFAICSLAPMIFTIYCESVGAAFSNMHLVEHAIYLFSYSNSWFNIIVFSIFREDLWVGFINMLVGMKSRQISHIRYDGGGHNVT